MSDIRIDRAVLTVKEDRPARTSSPIGINALSPKEDAVFKREDTSRKLYSPIGSPMAENTAAANDGSFFSNKQAPHHIMGLFGGTSHQSSMFIRSLSPATNLGPNGKIDASNQAVVQINDLDEATNEDIARSLPGLSPMNPMNHVNKINNAKRFEPPRRRAMSLVGTAGDRFANSDWSFDPNNFNNGQNIPYDHQVYSRSIEANNPWSNANVQQQEYYQYNNQQQYYNEQQYRAQQQQYYHMQQQAYQQQQQQQHHTYQQELSEQDEWITGMGGMDFENGDNQPKYGQHVPGFYNASLMSYQHRADTASPQQSPRYAPGVTRVTNQMSNLTLNQGPHLSTSPNYSAQSPAPTTTSTTSCLVLGVGFRSGWMGPPTGPASRSLLIYNLPQGILFTAAHSYTAMSRSGYDPSTSTMTLTASTSSSTTPSSTPPTTPSSSTAQSPMMSPFSSPRMTSINAPMLNLSIVNAESLTPSSPFSLNASTSVADQLISLLLNFGPIRSLQFSAGNSKTGMNNSSPGSELFNNSPFLIVSYFDIRHAQNAVLHLHACNFKNKKLEVQYFFPKDYTSLKEQNQGTLVIFNLDPNTSNEDLKSIFGEYGEIKEIRESPNKKHKFIEFYDVRDAERAMKYLNKSEVKGKKIKIEPSRPGGPRKNMLHQLTLDVDDDLQTPHAVTPTSNSVPAPVSAPANYQLYQGNVHYPNYPANTASNYSAVREPEVLKPYSPLSDKQYTTPTPNYAHHTGYHPALVPNPNPLIAPNSNASNHVPAKPFTNHSAAPSNPLFFDGPGLFSLTPSISAAPNPSTEHVINANLLSASPLDVFSSRDRTEFKPPSNTASPVKSAPSHATDGQPSQPSEHSVSAATKIKSDERPIPSTRPRAHSTNAVMKSSPSLFDDLRPVQYNSDVNEDSALFDDTASTGSESQTASTGSNGSTTPVNGAAAPITRGRRRTHSGRMSRDEDVVRYELYVDKVLNGEDTRTTLMIKNIPNKYDQEMLLTTVDKKYRGLYDFFYLPIDFKNKCNVGYAFVNFIQPVTIAQFYEDFNNKKWEKFNSEKVCKIAYARIQGKNQLIEHFKNSSLMFEDPKCRPIIFAASLDGHTAGPQEPFPIGPNVRPRNRKDSGGRNYKYNNTAASNGAPISGSSSTASTSHHHKKNSRDNSANSRPSNKDLSTDKEP